MSREPEEKNDILEETAADLPEEPTAEIPETDDDVKIYTEPTEGEKQTKVIPLAGAQRLVEEPEEAEAADQISWEDIDEEEAARQEAENAGTTHDDDPEIQNRLHQNRAKKVRSFRLDEDAASEENDAGADADDDEYIVEFTDYEDADIIAAELQNRHDRGQLGLAAAAIGELLLLLHTAAHTLGLYTLPLIYPIGAVGLLIVMAACNFPILRDGWNDLRDKRLGGESAVLVSVAVATVHTLLQFLQVTGTQNGLLPPLAGLGLLFAAVGRQLMARRIRDNFDFAADKNAERQAAIRIKDEKAALEIGRAAVSVGQPELVYYRPASFLTHYLERAYERLGFGKGMVTYTIGSAAASAAVAAVYGVVTGNWWQALYLLALGLCLTAPVALSLSPELSLFRAARRTRRGGGLLTGIEAVRRFGDLHALVVDAADLFPDGTVLLNGIKTFAGTRIDEAILDAAAVVMAAKSPLSQVFRRVIEDKTELLPEVDTLVYEQEMGLSGWVGGKRVLIGNRKLLDNHGVDFPSADYEMRHTQDDRRAVYLSVAGELSAVFIVTYTADESVCRTLRSLNKAGITLLVHTFDSNVTEEMLTETLHLNDYYVEVLNAAARLRYEQLFHDEEDEIDAVLAAGEGIAGKAIGLTACRRLFKGMRRTTRLALILAWLGLGLFALFAFATHTLPPVLWTVGYLAGSQLIIELIQQLSELR